MRFAARGLRSGVPAGMMGRCMDRVAIDEQVDDILARALAHEGIGAADALVLLGLPLGSLEVGVLCAVADRLTRERCGGVGEVFSQVGLNDERCSLGCGFCAFGAERSGCVLSTEEAVARAVALAAAGANAVGLMATADYPFERFLTVGRAARAALPADFPLAANVTDFGPPEAQALLAAGFTALYHVIRLREGIDSPVPPARRRQTLLAAHAVGLDVSYCLEPIGPEHTPDELVAGVLVGEEFTPTSMATMRRVPIAGTALAARGEISELAQARIQAVTTLLCARWSNLMMMGAHEPSMLFLRAGANRMTAEAGGNPRDTAHETAGGRGRTVADCARMIRAAGFTLRVGPSPALQGPLRR